MADPVLITVVAVVTIVGVFLGVPATLNSIRELRKGSKKDKLGKQFKELKQGVSTQVDSVSSDVATLIQTNSELWSEIEKLNIELEGINVI